MNIKIQNGQLKIKVKKFNRPQFTRQSVIEFVTSKFPYVIITVLIPLLLFTTYFSNINQENQIFRTYLFAIGIATSLFFVQLFLGKRKILFDPNGLTGVLVFNLVLTLTVILNTADSISSTFATSFFRSGSGIALISFIALFYLISYYTNRFHSVFDSKLFKYTLLISYIASMLKMVLDTDYMTTLDVIYSVVFGVLIYSSFREQFAKARYEKVLGLLFGFLVFFKIASGAHSVRYGNFVVLIALSYLFVVMVQLIKRRKNLPKLRNASTLVIFPAMVVLWMIIRFIFDKNALQLFVTEISRFFAQFNILSGGNLTGETVQYLLIGRGSDFILQNNSFASNILVSSGIIGFIGYLVIWLINIRLSLRLFKRSENSRNAFKLFYSVLFVALSFYTNMPFILTIMWWVVFADNAVLFARRKPELTEEGEYRLFRIPKLNNVKVSNLIAGFLLTGFLVFCAVLIAFITRNII